MYSKNYSQRICQFLVLYPMPLNTDVIDQLNLHM
jgi:hypothetical protein